MRAEHLLGTFSALPLVELDAIAPGISLILAPHPDDESLGCGGLIAALCDAGRSPLIVAVTDGTGSHPHSLRYPAPRLKALREAELREAARILGVAADGVHCLGLPDTRAPRDGPAFEAAVARIAALGRANAVRTIFATWPHDPHGDHQAVALMGTAAARCCEARLRLYPVWGWLLPPEQPIAADPVSGARLDITDLLPRKRRAVAAHASQVNALIDDDPTAFRLPAELLAVHDRGFEVFIDP